MAKGKKRGHFFLVLLISYLVLMLYRVVLTYIIGSKGITYFSLPNELFVLLAGAFSYGITEGMGVLIENRVERGQYYNAGVMFRSGVFVAGVLGILISAVLAFFGKSIVAFFNVPLSYMAYIVMVPSIFLMIMAGVFRGYCKGNGYRHVVSLSYLLFIASYIVFGIIFSLICQRKGNQVSALLRVEDYKYSYGALGASIGLLVASIICFIHSLTLYILMNRRSNFQENRDYNRSFEDASTGIKNIIKNSFFPAAIWFAVYSFILVDEFIIFLSKDLITSMDFTYGEYYGKSFPLPVIAGLILLIVNYNSIRKTISLLAKEESRGAREKLKFIIHRIITYGLFIATVFIVLSDNILNSLFKNNGQDAPGFLRLQAILMVAGLFAVVFLKILVTIGYTQLSAAACAIAGGVHILLSLLFSKSFKMLISGAIISDIIMFLIIAGGCFFIVSRCFQYTQEWFRTFGVSTISALGCGIVGFLVNMLLSPLVGKFAAIAIVIVIMIFIYMIILLLLRGYEEEELDVSIFGKVMLFLNSLFHL